MIKTYSDFTAVVSGKCSLYAQIPDEHLSYEGANVYKLYKLVNFNACFASNATELLDLLQTDEDLEGIAKNVKSELRQIIRCLERLASKESLAPTT